MHAPSPPPPDRLGARSTLRPEVAHAGSRLGLGELAANDFVVGYLRIAAIYEGGFASYKRYSCHERFL